jgi:uncharacterized membrane protein
MKRSDMRWLQTRLDSWVAADLIRTDQAEAIRRFQDEQPERQFFTFFGLLVSVGALSVGIGIILIVSYNWERIPPVVRQLAFLLLVAGLAEARLRAAGKSFATRALDVLWVLLPLAGIGLWGQIYQLSGDTFTPLAVTLVLALPVVWLGGHGAAATTHAFIFVWAVYTGAFEAGSWISMRDLEPLRAWLTLALSVLLWTGMLYQTRRFARPNAVLALWLAFLVFLFSMVETGSALDVDSGGVYFLMASALGILFWAGRGPLGLAIRESGDVGWAIAAALLYALSFLHNDVGLGGGVNMPGLYYGLLLTGIAVAGLIFADIDEKAGLGGSTGFKLMLGLPLALSAIIILTRNDVMVGYLANLALLGYCLYGMHAGVLRADKRLINQGVAVLGLLMVTRFIDYFGGLLTSGSAFIVMGLLFLGIAYGMNRGRQRLLEQMQGGNTEQVQGGNTA